MERLGLFALCLPLAAVSFLLSFHPIITTVGLLCLPSEQKAVTPQPELVGRSMCSTHTSGHFMCHFTDFKLFI